MRVMIFGKQRAGKDTAADYLCEQYGFTKIRLADPVYDIAKKYFGMRKKDRGLLIAISEHLKQIDPDVWVKYALKRARRYDRVVISDVRFPNEYALLRQEGFKAIYIVASQEARSKRDGYSPEYEDHPSENYFQQFTADYVIVNELRLVDLCRQLDVVMRRWLSEEEAKA